MWIFHLLQAFIVFPVQVIDLLLPWKVDGKRSHVSTFSNLAQKHCLHDQRWWYSEKIFPIEIALVLVLYKCTVSFRIILCSEFFSSVAGAKYLECHKKCHKKRKLEHPQRLLIWPRQNRTFFTARAHWYTPLSKRTFGRNP